MSLIDIIVGVKNEEKYIKRCINSCKIKLSPIIILSSLMEKLMTEPRKLLKKSAKQINEYNYLKTQWSDKFCRNIGLEVSEAEYVAYLDGHCYVNEDWLEILYNTFLSHEKKCDLAGVGSTYSSPPDDSSFGKSVAYALQTFLGGFGTAFTADNEIVNVDTVAFALYKRSLLEKEQITYDEKMTQCEDTDFNHQLIKKGYVLLKHPKASVYQYRRKNLGQFTRQMIDYGKGVLN
jgi:glycosyltransferase involved in cell wall biosynthesis